MRKANEYQGKATLKLAITFEPKGGEMVISARLESTTPSPASFPIRAFVDREGDLVDEDPRQLKLTVMPTRTGTEES
ncbi:MAG: hypothetical protein WA208_00865 [Thermoanaerobaculia bacterium]